MGGHSREAPNDGCLGEAQSPSSAVFGAVPRCGMGAVCKGLWPHGGPQRPCAERILPGRPALHLATTPCLLVARLATADRQELVQEVRVIPAAIRGMARVFAQMLSCTFGG